MVQIGTNQAAIGYTCTAKLNTHLSKGPLTEDLQKLELRGVSLQHSFAVLHDGGQVVLSLVFLGEKKGAVTTLHGAHTETGGSSCLFTLSLLAYKQDCRRSQLLTITQGHWAL